MFFLAELSMRKGSMTDESQSRDVCAGRKADGFIIAFVFLMRGTAKSMLTVHVNDDILIDMRRSAQDHTPQNAWWKHRDLSPFYRVLPELYKCGNEQKSGDNQERTSTQ